VDANLVITPSLVLLAIRLVQPGRLSDIVEGINRLTGAALDSAQVKAAVAGRLSALRDADFVCLYTGQRYMLRPKGREVVEITGIKLQIDHRRMFLLKETRRANDRVRSGARNGLLQQ
jgi:hypothetical protein